MAEELAGGTAGNAFGTPRPLTGSSSSMPGATPNGYAGSLGLLEFDQIRSAVASYIHTLMGREACMSLMPSGDVLEIATRQQETSEARRFIDHGGALEFGPEENFQEFFHRAMLGGLLRGKELHSIQEMIRAGARQPDQPAAPRRTALALRNRGKHPRAAGVGSCHRVGHRRGWGGDGRR